MTKRSARPLEVIEVCVGKKITCLDEQLTMTRIELKPLDIGSSLMKFIEIESQGQMGTERGLRSPKG